MGYKRRVASHETRELSDISLLGRCFRFLPDSHLLHVHAISLTFEDKLETGGNLIHDKRFLKSVDSECFELV